MKPTWTAAAGLLVAMLTAIASCEYFPFVTAKPPPTKVVATATPTPSATPTPVPSPTPGMKKHRRRHRPSAAETPAAQASATGPVITTGESARADAEIERTIDRVESKLAQINRQTLSAQEAADYDRIKGFIAEARTALQEQDNLGAHSLADKASRLVSQLAGHVSGQ